jgi:hypothetical protein
MAVTRKMKTPSQTLMPEVSLEVNSALAIHRIHFAFTITFRHHSRN